MENLEKFVDELIAEKGFAEKDPDVLEQIKFDLLDRVEDRINAMIMEKLPPESLSDFEEKLDTANEEEMNEFIQSHIPDIKDRVTFELVSFKRMYLSN